MSTAIRIYLPNEKGNPVRKISSNSLASEVNNMDFEGIFVKISVNKTKFIKSELKIYEEVSENEDMVLLNLFVDGAEFSGESEDFFSALQDLRKKLEKKNLQIMCNGAAENVYPSTMQVSMGGARMAYKLYIGESAKIEDVVDIFECDESLKFVEVDKQDEFYRKWLKSIIK